MGLLSNPEITNQNNLIQGFLMLKLSFVKCGVILLKTNYLGCSVRMGGPS